MESTLAGSQSVSLKDAMYIVVQASWSTLSCKLVGSCCPLVTPLGAYEWQHVDMVTPGVGLASRISIRGRDMLLELYALSSQVSWWVAVQLQGEAS
jgi:hypothetical protein